MKSRYLLPVSLLLAAVSSTSFAATLSVGDQRGNARAILEAAGELNNLPYTLDWHEFANAAPLLEAMRAGSIDAGSVGDAPLTFAVAAGLDAKGILATQYAGNAIIVKKGSAITTPQQLAGKRIATVKGSSGHNLALQVLERAGVAVKAVNFVFTTPAEATLVLDQGGVDAVSTWEPYVSFATQQSGAQIIADGKDYPALNYLVASNSAIAARRSELSDLSTTYGEPFHAARTLATLDHFSHGRAAWNAVTSTNDGEAHNFSRQQLPPHGERYQRAAEFIDAVQLLMASWQPGARVADKASGVYVDASKVSYSHFHGEHFQIKGPLTVSQPPQGRPVQILAGVSADFQQVATRLAEVIFTVQPELARAQLFYQQFKQQMALQGRPPAACKVLPGIMPVLAATQRAAEEKRRELDELVNPLAGLSFMSASMNYDLSQHDPDELFPDIFAQISGSKGRFEYVIRQARQEGKTLAQVAKTYAASASFPLLVGIPRSIADEMIRWVEERACDGFVLMPADMPASLNNFADYVVPELQRRGAFRKEYQGETLREHLAVPL
ncbi:NtaA/DmoA family FMN-dependent monooxygenase [Erwinia aphidicola]|uniref:NtaA/DmoA family FMN-dependent monooxygenase n=1 Tax=Erwinia aphidicola TaxID=68334 RepID=UPI0030D1A1E2